MELKKIKKLNDDLRKNITNSNVERAARNMSGENTSPNGPSKRYWIKKAFIYPSLARYCWTSAPERSGSMALESFHQPPITKTQPKPTLKVSATTSARADEIVEGPISLK
ncbi:MAG: hypothetical protein IIB64_04050 [Proteobacteria bacterium]|nr:hypothetical protein [Pseudomonadota bacterium]